MSGRRWWPPAAWAAAILILTSIPNPDLGRIGEILPPGADKLVHAAMYAVLGWLWWRASRAASWRWRAAGRALLAILAFAALDEWHQRFIPGRSADVLDWAADGVGAAAGLTAGMTNQRRERVS